MGGRCSKPVALSPSDCVDRPSDSTDACATSFLVEQPAADLAGTDSIALLDLGSDILVEILSYLGSGRMEQGPMVSERQGSRVGTAITTHHDPPIHVPTNSSCCLVRTIPFVNKQVRHLWNASDALWMAMLKRMIRSDPVGWEESVLALVEGRYHLPSITATSVQSTVNRSVFGDITSSPPWAIYGEDSPLWRFRVRFKGRKLSSLSGCEEELGHFVDLLCETVGHRHRIRGEHEKMTKHTNEESACNDISDAKHAAIHLVLSRKTYTLPLLHMPAPSLSPRIGQMIRLDASDPRHRPTVSVITTSQSRRDLRCGLQLGDPFPRFVLQSSAGAVSARGRVDAFLVELRRCHLQKSGRRADLFAVPIERVRIIETEDRGEDDGIIDASFQLDFS